MKSDKAVIFDLDGTLWDSTPEVVNAWNEVLKTYNNPRMMDMPTMKSLMGLAMTEIADRFFGTQDPLRYEKLHAIEAFENGWLEKTGGILYPDILPVLEELSKRYSLMIVSNCQSGYIETFLKAHHTEHLFEDIECIGNTGLSKDENIRLIMKRNGIEKALYVGDIEKDYLSACKAEVPFIHAKWGFGQVDCDIKAENALEMKEKIIEVLEN